MGLSGSLARGRQGCITMSQRSDLPDPCSASYQNSKQVCRWVLYGLKSNQALVIFQVVCVCQEPSGLHHQVSRRSDLLVHGRASLGCIFRTVDGYKRSLVSRSADTQAYLASNPLPECRDSCLHSSTLLENNECRLVWMSADKIRLQCFCGCFQS